MAEALPAVDPDFVLHCQQDYQQVFSHGTAEEVDSSRLRLVWALAHSSVSNHQTRGLEIAKAQLGASSSEKDKKEYTYLAAGKIMLAIK